MDAYSFLKDDIWYNILSDDKKTVEVLQNQQGYKYEGDVVIPEFVDINGETYSVVSIGDCAFYQSNITSITIPKSVTSIGRIAFYQCKQLNSVHISDLTAWCNIDFSDSYSYTNPLSYAHYLYLNGVLIEDLVIPKDVPTIKNGSFFGHSGITSVTIPNSVKNIAAWAFAGCSRLHSVSIPNGVTSIGKGAFSKCSALTSITIPNSMTSIDEEVFSECSALSSVTIPNSITSIGNHAFTGCCFTSVNIPQSVTTIGDNAFSNCIALTSFAIPHNVTSIGKGVFSGCEALLSVTIPNGVTSIGRSAFSRCSFTSVSIPNSVTSIGDYAFNGCALTNVTIPNNVTTIGENAFSDCRALNSVTIPKSVTSIGKNAFSSSALNSVTLLCPSVGNWFSNSSVKEVILGEGVTSVDGDAFSNCNYLNSVTIPSSLTTLKSSAFYKCSGFTVICLSETPPSLSSKIDASKLEVPLGCIEKYINAPFWGEIGAIYAKNNDRLVVGVSFEEEGKSVARIPNYSSGIMEVEANQMVSIESIKGDGAYCLLMKGTRDVSESFRKTGSYSFYPSIYYKDNIIKTIAFESPTTIVQVTEAGTLLDKIDINNLDNIYGLKVIGDINGTDILVIRKMTNLKILDLQDANIVNGGTSYYQNYVTSKDAIGDYFFKEKDNLVKIILPQSITSIKYGAFDDCKNLISITIPSNVSYVSGGIFKNCDNLVFADIQCPKVGDCFNGMKSLKEVVLGYNVLSCDFKDCSNLTVTFHSKDIKLFWFGKNSLEKITISDGVNSINDKCFENFISLKSITFENGVESIGKSAFEACYGLNSIVIPNSVKTIGESAFMKCTKLTSVTIGDNVESIEKRVFSGCCGLTSISIPNSVKTIKDEAFKDCGSLKTVNIGESVTSIGEDAFYNCSKLSSITIPNNVISIGRNAFFWCNSLSSLDIGNSVSIIDYYAFGRCNSLKVVTIPKSVKTIESGAFSECRNLTLLTIGENVTSLGSNAFSYCRGLSYVNIPNSVTSIDYGAFQYCSGLSSVTIGNSVTNIKDRAFFECRNLSSISISNSVISFGSNAFERCSSLSSLSIPNSVKTISKGCFNGCVSLASVVIPNSVVSFGDGAFSNCTSLSSVVFEDGKNSIDFTNGTASRGNPVEYFFDCPLHEVYWGRNVTYSPWNDSYWAMACLPPFSHHKELSSVTIGSGVASIDNRFFIECSGLTSVLISNNVTSIRAEAFRDCSGLTTLTIPNSVTSIGTGVFVGCNNLTELISLNTLPPVIQNGTFPEYIYKNTTLKVPRGSKTIYWLHPYWENFLNIEEIEVSDVKTIKVDNNGDLGHGKVYNLNGEMLRVKADEINTLPKGIYIIDGEKVVIK